MAWTDLAPEFRQVAERACTPAQLEVLVRVADGKGLKRIARELGIARESVRDRLHRAEVRIRQEVASQRGYDWQGG